MSLVAEKHAKSGDTPLAQLAALCAPDLKAVDAAILTKMHSDVPLIPQLAKHLIAAGGKRLRPLLTIAAADLCGYKGERAHNLAACVEFIHTATLLHDDVVDESNTRRGNQSANAVFGNEAAVLVGDFLFSRAFQLMVDDGSLAVLRILSNASAVIAEGEVMQLATSHNLDTGFEQYLKIITAKTAALFAAACEVGGVIANADRKSCQALYEYGLNLGIAFQIADDVLDYTASETKLGKSLGDDLKDGKITLPVIYALESVTPEQKTFWHDVIVKDRFDEHSLAHAIEICEAHDAFSRALDTARDYQQRSLHALDALPDHPIKSHFAALSAYVVDRSM